MADAPPADEEAAALTMQKLARGRAARKQIAEEQKAQEKAATAMQAAQRGQMARKKTSQGVTGAMDRVNMGGAIESQPTAEMRAALEAAGVQPMMSPEELTAVSTNFNKWLDDYRHDQGKEKATSWFNLFAEVDKDGSGFVTFDELEFVCRSKLKKGPKDMPQRMLKRLWCTLDADDSNSIQKDEMSEFFRSGMVKEKKAGVKRQATVGNIVGSISADRVGMSGALASQPTKEMRADLEAKELESMLDDEALKDFSVQMNEWLDAFRHKDGKAKATSWFNLFAEVDKDGSGFVTFDELEFVIRSKLEKGPKVVPLNRLKALWCTLDADDSNSIQKDEMADFFRSGFVKEKKLTKQKTSQNLVGAMDRVNMGGAIESQPTGEMRAELEAAGEVFELDAEALVAVSTKFNKWLEDFRYNEGKGESSSWFNLFAEVDKDGSGFVTFDELEFVCRGKLKKGPKEMPQNTLKALWCTLDADDSNSIQKDEMASFFKSGAVKKEKKVRQKTSQNLVGAMDRVNMGGAIESQPTAEMRAELEKAGVEMLDADKLKEISMQMNKWLEEARHKDGKAQSTSWFNLFAEVDKDGSGFITYDEIEWVVRTKLEKKEKAMPTTKLKALWCSLDADNSNSIQKDEMAGFFKEGMIKKEKMVRQKTSQNLVGAMDRVNMGGAIESQPTAEMRAELEKAGVALPDDAAQLALSRKFNEWLEEYRYKEGKAKSSSWFNLFAEVDKDGSGFITFDELEFVVRSKLKKGQKTMPQNTLKALWCALDDDNSNQIQKEELAPFFKRGMVKEKKIVKQKTSQNLVGAMDRVNMGRALDSQPTAEMRTELEAAGVVMPDLDGVLDLAKFLEKKLEDYRHKDGKAKATSFYNLFKEVDKDNSGFITYDEMREVVRQRLKINKTELPEPDLKALWCVLDGDDSNQIQMDEFSAFLKGKPILGKKPKPKAKPRRPRSPPKGERPKPSLMSKEAVEARAAERAEERKAKVAWHHAYVKAQEARDAAARRMRARAFALKEAEMELGRQKAASKRKLLTELRLQILKSPVADGYDARLGGARILPLYESERLIAAMERENGRLWRWPSPKKMLRSPSTPLVSELSRLETLLPHRPPSGTSSPRPQSGGAVPSGNAVASLRQQVSDARASMSLQGSRTTSRTTSRTPSASVRGLVPSSSMPVLSDSPPEIGGLLPTAEAIAERAGLHGVTG